MDFTKSFNNISETARQREAAQDTRDLNLAMAGIDAGQLNQRLPNQDKDPLTGKSKAEKAFRLTLDWLLLNDPNYQQAHEDLMTALREGQSEAQTALDIVFREQALIQDARENLMSKATKLQDGREVFKDKDGRARFANGEYVPDDLAATIQWRDGSPAYEEIKALNIRAAELKEAENELRGIQAEFGDIHADATNNDEPFSPKRIQTEKDRVDGLRDQINEIEMNTQIQSQDHVHRNILKPEVETSSNVSDLAAMPNIVLGGKP